MWLVLAYENHPTESNKVIGENLADLKSAQPGYTTSALKYEIARALAFNKANATPSEPLPPELERLLLPERPNKVKWP